MERSCESCPGPFAHRCEIPKSSTDAIESSRAWEAPVVPAFLSWIDFSSADRERMRRAIALFQEHETRDELGLGTIRDAFADTLYPGTSTIQTRLRYFLFVPWMYRELERAGVGSEDVARRARKAETDLTFVLLESEDTDGVIGKRAGRAVQRLPSSIYWAGLSTFGICLFAGSQDQYHRQLDTLRKLRRGGADPDDAGVTREAFATWHPRLPDPPSTWPKQAEFALRRSEAEFLQGRITASRPDSLLAWLAVHGRAGQFDSPELYGSELPKRLRDQLDLARRFSLVMHGAAWIYNVMLAELAGRDDWLEHHREGLRAWADGPEGADLKTFDSDVLWRFVDDVHANVPTPTRRFVRDWVALLREHAPAKVAEVAAARDLVRMRERALKGSRSRFTNRRALDQWSGASGTGRFNYRWHVVRSHLEDLHAGLAREG